MSADVISKTANLLLEVDKKLDNIDKLVSRISTRLLDKTALLSKELNKELENKLEEILEATNAVVEDYIRDLEAKRSEELKKIISRLEDQAKKNYSRALNEVFEKVVGALV